MIKYKTFLSMMNLCNDFFYLDSGIVLPVTIGSAEAFPSPMLENEQLHAPVLLNDLCRDLGRGEQWFANGDVVSIRNHINVLYFNSIPLLCVKTLNPDNIAGRYLILFPSGLYNCVHSASSFDKLVH